MATRGKVNKSAIRDDEKRLSKARPYRYLVLIVCEDQKTEPYYFESFKKQFDSLFPNETLFLRAVGTGRNSKDVVEQAKTKREELYNESNKTVDEVWAVFDKDDLDKSGGNAQRFQDAFEIAEKENIKIAYSNEAFELWLLLHFIDVDSNTPISRRDIYTKLEDNINKGRTDTTKIVYEHKHAATQVIDIVLKSGSESDAISRAEKLDKTHTQKKTKPINANPNTKMYLLVKQLRDLFKFYSYTPG